MHYNGANSYLFDNGTEIIKFKVKDSEIAAHFLCLENILKEWLMNVYDFSADYNAIADILDIGKYLTKKNKIV